ncbi:aggregate spidroin 1A variant 1, partial [Caerostris extrusa]
MGWISHVVVFLCLVGTQVTKAYPQNYQPGIGVVQNDPLLDEKTGENFANVFAQSLEQCGAFTYQEAQEYKEIIEVLTRAFGSFPDLQKAPPGVLKATAAGFASAVAERTAADVGPDGDLMPKTHCVIQALRKCFIVTTGVTNPYFISEVEKLIEVFYLTNGIQYKPIYAPPPPQEQQNLGGGVQGDGYAPNENLREAAPSDPLGRAVHGKKKQPSSDLGGIISGIFGGGKKSSGTTYYTYSTESYYTGSYETYETESYTTGSYETYETN